MLFRLVRPVKRSGSSIPHFVQRIPADVRNVAVGRRLEIPLGEGTVRKTISPRADSVRFSLRTRDPNEAKIRQARAAGYLETVWQALRQTDPVALTHEQATALSGELYRAWAAEEGERTLAILWTPSGWVRDTVSPGEEGEHFRAIIGRLTEADGEQELEIVLGSIIDGLLLKKGIAAVELQTRVFLLHEFHRALCDAFALRQRNAEGDYSPDTKAQRFPEWSDARSRLPTIPASVSLRGLVEDWWREASATGRKPSTHENYRNAVGLLAKFLGHDDAGRIAPEDVIRFKDYRLAAINPRTGKAISARTVQDNDLAAFKTIFEWAVINRRLRSNPAKGIGIKLTKAPKLRSKGFTDAEAEAILSAAYHVPRGEDRPETHSAKRWVPWLCAYTGARVGEIAQLRKKDLGKEGDYWVITISPEAGTVKTNEARFVVLHPYLIEQGFAEFVAAAPDGHLFLRPAQDGSVLGPLRGLKNRLAEFSRRIVSDPHVAPNHGWRHRFKTIGMEAGIDSRVLDAIQGQAARSVADSYGDVTVATMAAAISKLPRVLVEFGTD